MIVGYARVSKEEQNETLQLDALHAAGCEKVFVDKMSGSVLDRPQLAAMMNILRRGDKVVIWKLDRLGRSVKHLLDIVANFQEEGIDIQVLTGSLRLDTTNPQDRLMFHIMAALAEFERALTIERTHAGLAAARARGRIGGRPKAITAKQFAAATELIADGCSVRGAAKQVNVSATTLFRALKGGHKHPIAA